MSEVKPWTEEELAAERELNARNPHAIGANCTAKYLATIDTLRTRADTLAEECRARRAHDLAPDVGTLHAVNVAMAATDAANALATDAGKGSDGK